MDKKVEIISAAFKLFLKKGYMLSMSEIANAVKIKTPSLYSHFNSKDEIIALTIKTEIEHYFDAFYNQIQSVNDKSCEERLKSTLFFVVDYFKEYDRLRFWRNIPLIQNAELRDMSSLLIQNNDIYFNQKLKCCFKKGIKSGEIRQTVSAGAVQLYFTMIQGILNEMLVYQNSSLELNGYADALWVAYWDGIKADV